MTTERRKHTDEPPGRSARRKPEVAEERRPGAVPELVRRALSLGLSGFFLTEEAIRKAFGDAVPRDWADYVAHQSDRTRKEFLERLSFEIGQSIEKIDLSRMLAALLEGRTLEVKAEIRLSPKGSDPARRLHVAASTRSKGSA